MTTSKKLTIAVIVLLAIAIAGTSAIAFASNSAQPSPGIIIWKNECPGAPDGWIELRTYNNRILVLCHVEWDATEGK